MQINRRKLFCIFVNDTNLKDTSTNTYLIDKVSLEISYNKNYVLVCIHFCHITFKGSRRTNNYLSLSNQNFNKSKDFVNANNLFYPNKYQNKHFHI